MGKRLNTELIKRTATDWGKVLVLLLDEAGVVLLTIVVLRFFGIRIPLPIAIAIGLLVGIFVFIIHVAVIPSFHRRIVTGSEGMIGAQATVVKPLNPVGAVTVKGEYWKARAVEEHIEVGEDVEIVGFEGLTLKVKRKEE